MPPYKPLGKFGGGKTLDARYVIVDVCGFRETPDACTKDGEVFDVGDVIRGAGFVFEELGKKRRGCG